MDQNEKQKKEKEKRDSGKRNISEHQGDAPRLNTNEELTNQNKLKRRNQ